MVAAVNCIVGPPSVHGIHCYSIMVLITSESLIVAVIVPCLLRLAWPIMRIAVTRIQTHVSRYLNSASNDLENQTSLYVFSGWIINLLYLYFQAGRESSWHTISVCQMGENQLLNVHVSMEFSRLKRECGSLLTMHYTGENVISWRSGIAFYSLDTIIYPCCLPVFISLPLETGSKEERRGRQALGN